MGRPKKEVVNEMADKDFPIQAVVATKPEEVKEVKKADETKGPKSITFSCSEFPQLSLVLVAFGEKNENNGRALKNVTCKFNGGIFTCKDTDTFRNSEGEKVSLVEAVRECVYFKKGKIKEGALDKKIEEMSNLQQGMVMLASHSPNKVVGGSRIME
jgi:hypothetical protein